MFLEDKRVYEVIHLDAVNHNLSRIHELTGDMKIIAVLKTDGYGHGAVPIMKEIEHEEYLWGYAVATLEEGENLKKAGALKPVLLLGASFMGQYEAMLDYDIRPTVFEYDTACVLNEFASRRNKRFKIHVKIDSGMNRIGIRASDEAVDIVKKIASLSNIEIEGIFTHFARADEADKSYAKAQYDRFMNVVDTLKKDGIDIPVVHCENSAAIIDLGYEGCDAARAGIILYGLWPSDEVDKSRIDLKPIMELKSTVTYVKEVQPGDEISYGGTYKATEVRRIATVPVGYGDGYPRSLSNKGVVLIEGKRAPIVGRVCMDQFMVDVTDIPNARRGSHVTLVGSDGDECITVDELSKLSGRFNYEFVCDISKRVPRIAVN